MFVGGHAGGVVDLPLLLVAQGFVGSAKKRGGVSQIIGYLLVYLDVSLVCVFVIVYVGMVVLSELVEALLDVCL